MWICIKNTRWLGVSLVLLSALVFAAGGAGPMRKKIELSMLVAGHINIEPDGTVSQVGLDQQEKLPPGVVEWVRASALKWRFEPVLRDGKAIRMRAPMSVRLVARKRDDGQYLIQIRNADFQGKYDPSDPANVGFIKMRLPKYPDEASWSRISGTVYLRVKVERDGSVADVAVEQVNLRFIAAEDNMRRARNVLAKNAVAAARNWTFRIPSEGPSAAQASWDVRVPLCYSLDQSALRGEEYGRWYSYIPGPLQHVPWVSATSVAGSSPDALADDGVYPADSRGPRLLTPL